MRRSQNGFDSSGYAANISWAADGTHFSHWPCRSAGWQGAFDPASFSYSTISWDNLRGTVSLLQRIALSLRSYPAVLGLEALNEPWQFTPIDVLKVLVCDSRSSYMCSARVPTACCLRILRVHDPYLTDRTLATSCVPSQLSRRSIGMPTGQCEQQRQSGFSSCRIHFASRSGVVL